MDKKIIGSGYSKILIYFIALFVVLIGSNLLVSFSILSGRIVFITSLVLLVLTIVMYIRMKTYSFNLFKDNDRRWMLIFYLSYLLLLPWIGARFLGNNFLYANKLLYMFTFFDYAALIIMPVALIILLVSDLKLLFKSLKMKSKSFFINLLTLSVVIFGFLFLQFTIF